MLQKRESVEKVSELCVIDIYIVSFVKSTHIQRAQNRQLLMTRIGGARIFV